MRKADLEHFLVTNIISMNTHFRVRMTHNELQHSTKIISEGETHSTLLTTLNVLNVETTISIIHNSYHNSTCNLRMCHACHWLSQPLRALSRFPFALYMCVQHYLNNMTAYKTGMTPHTVKWEGHKHLIWGLSVILLYFSLHNIYSTKIILLFLANMKLH
jgi:hypothetical protein